MSALAADVEARVHSITSTRADWPCRKGCDHCCRNLAALPRLTAPEWNLLRGALVKLPDAVIERIRNTPGERPDLCPLLDTNTGACLVYEQRPIACRTYGFYVERDKGLYCGIIELRVREGAMADVVWGNHESVDHQLAELGGARSLRDWVIDFLA